MSREMPADHPRPDKKPTILNRKKKGCRTKAALPGRETGSRQSESTQGSVRAAKNIVVAYVEHQNFTEAQDFLCELDENTFSVLKKTYPAFVRALVKLYIHKKEFTRVYKMAEEGFGSLTEDEKLKIWDDTHYVEKEHISGKPLTPLLKFRVRQRNPPPEGVCAAGSRPSNALPVEAKERMREWLNAHLDHPYPDMEERTTLANVTGLKENQVRTWFANARRRLRAKQKEEAILAEQKRAQKRALENTTNTGTHQSSLSHSIEAILESHPSYQSPMGTRPPSTTPQMTPSLPSQPQLPLSLKGHVPPSQVKGQLTKENIQQQDLYLNQMSAPEFSQQVAAQMGQLSRERVVDLSTPPGIPLGGANSLALGRPGVGRLTSLPLGRPKLNSLTSPPLTPLMKGTPLSCPGYGLPQNASPLATVPQWQALPPHLYQGLGQLRMPCQDLGHQKSPGFCPPDPVPPPTKMFCPCLGQQQKAACPGLPPFCSLATHHGNKVPQSPVSPQCAFGAFRYQQPDHVATPMTPTTLTFGSQPYDGYQHPSMHHNLDLYANDHSYYRFLASPDMQMRFPAAGPVTSTPKPPRDESTDSLLFLGQSDLTGFTSPASLNDSGLLSPTLATATHFSPPHQTYMQMLSAATCNMGKTSVTIPTQHVSAACKQPLTPGQAAQVLVPSSSQMHGLQREPGVYPSEGGVFHLSQAACNMAALRNMTQAPAVTSRVTYVTAPVTRDVGRNTHLHDAADKSPSNEGTEQGTPESPLLVEKPTSPPRVVVSQADQERPSTPELLVPSVRKEPAPKPSTPANIKPKPEMRKSTPVEKSVLAKLAEMVQQRQQEYETIMAKRQRENKNQQKKVVVDQKGYHVQIQEVDCVHLAPEKKLADVAKQTLFAVNHNPVSVVTYQVAARYGTSDDKPRQQDPGDTSSRTDTDSDLPTQTADEGNAGESPSSQLEGVAGPTDGNTIGGFLNQAPDVPTVSSSLTVAPDGSSSQGESGSQAETGTSTESGQTSGGDDKNATSQPTTTPEEAELESDSVSLLHDQKSTQDSCVSSVKSGPLNNEDQVRLFEICLPSTVEHFKLKNPGNREFPAVKAENVQLETQDMQEAPAATVQLKEEVVGPTAGNIQFQRREVSLTSVDHLQLKNEEVPPKPEQNMQIKNEEVLAKPAQNVQLQNKESPVTTSQRLQPNNEEVLAEPEQHLQMQDLERQGATVQGVQLKNEGIQATIVDGEQYQQVQEQGLPDNKVKVTEETLILTMLTPEDDVVQTSAADAISCDSGGIHTPAPSSTSKELCGDYGNPKVEQNNADSGYVCGNESLICNQQTPNKVNGSWLPRSLDVNGNEIHEPSAIPAETSESDGGSPSTAASQPDSQTHERQECARALLDLHMCDKKENMEES